MKKRLVIFMTAVTAATAVLLLVGTACIYRGWQQEIKRVENLAGAVIFKHPESEEVFVSAAMDTELQALGKGSEIMSRYGYDGDMPLNEDYRRIMYAYVAVCAALLVVTAGSGAVASYMLVKKRRQQESLILSMLEQCLSGDYDLSEEKSSLEALENPLFADSMEKLAQSLKLKTERLHEERDNTKSMVTDISHQLKTPLSALRVCLDMYDEAESQQERSEFFERSLQQLEKLEGLTAALVNISRLESHMIVLKRETVMLSEILVGAVNSVYHKAKTKEIDILTDDFDDIALDIDRKWTGEAVFNILDNAVKYSPRGSRVEISVTLLFSFIRIEIRDRGIGIPLDEHNKIFRRFYRGSSPDVTREEGSGVGLYLCRRIIEEQQGTVTAKSAHDGGSIFVIQLPLPYDR